MDVRQSVSRWFKPGLLLPLLAMVPAGGSTGTANQSLSAVINPIGSIAVPASATLISSSTTFKPFTGSVSVSYKARTSTAGGGTITMNVSSDFTPSGGPSAASGALTYTCSAATLGSACSGSQTASVTAQTPVLTLPASACTGGGGSCSSQSPNSVGVSFTLSDNPSYSTGAYSAKVIFTISTT